MTRRRVASALGILSAVGACLCALGCARTLPERSVHDMTVNELREERERLLKRLAEVQGLGGPAEDERERLMLEVARLRALHEVYLGGGRDSDEEATAPKLALPEDPLELTLVQRESKSVRGSRGTVRVRIGDVTGGQVLVEVVGRSGPALMDTVSMKPGDVAEFRVADEDYYLTLVTLRNFLIGDDFAVFEVSARRPSAERLKSVREAARWRARGKRPKPDDHADH